MHEPIAYERTVGKMHERYKAQRSGTSGVKSKRRSSFGSVSNVGYYMWVSVSLVVVLTALNPAGTNDTSFFARIIIWALQIGLLLPLMVCTHQLLQASKAFQTVNPWIRLLASGLVGSVLFVPFGLAIDSLFGLDDWTGVSGLADILGLFFEELSYILAPAVLIWAGINAPLVLQLDFRENTTQSAGDGEDKNKPNSMKTAQGILSLLPGQLGTDVVYLQSELHYVRVVTTQGECLQLYNLKDAIADMEAVVTGVQTHRSYWVAGQHISGIRSEGGRKYLLTTGKHKIPISRRNAASVAAFLQK